MFYRKGLPRNKAVRHALSSVVEMEKFHLLMDTATFSAIAATAAVFGHAHINSQVTALSFAIAAIAITWMTVSLAMKRDLFSR